MKVKIAIGLINKTTTMYIHHTSLPSLLEYNMKSPNFYVHVTLSESIYYLGVDSQDSQDSQDSLQGVGVGKQHNTLPAGVGMHYGMCRHFHLTAKVDLVLVEEAVNLACGLKKKQKKSTKNNTESSYHCMHTKDT